MLINLVNDSLNISSMTSANFKEETFDLHAVLMASLSRCSLWYVVKSWSHAWHVVRDAEVF
jgi:hypothetical protein